MNSAVVVGVKWPPATIYLFAASVLVTIGAIFGPIRNPYGNEFGRVIVPGLVLLNALPWLALPVKLSSRIAGTAYSLLLGACLLLIYGHVLFSNFVVILLLVLVFHAMTLWFFALASTEKSILLASHIVIAFVAIVGLDLRLTGVAIHLGTTAVFLFWSPMAALLLWTGYATSRTNGWEQAALVGVIFQVGIGLLDVGTAWHTPWGFPCAFLVWFAALGLTVYLAKSWERRTQETKL